MVGLDTARTVVGEKGNEPFIQNTFTAKLWQNFKWTRLIGVYGVVTLHPVSEILHSPFAIEFWIFGHFIFWHLFHFTSSLVIEAKWSSLLFFSDSDKHFLFGCGLIFPKFSHLNKWTKHDSSQRMCKPRTYGFIMK